MMQVPLIKPDLPRLDEVATEFDEVLKTGRITNFGKFLLQFEEEASNFLGAHAVALSSGTAGLVLGLQALGLQPMQKVILPGFTFIATAQAVLYAGGIPLFADIDETLTVSPRDVAELLHQHHDVAIILPVHTYGLPCDVAALQQVVDEASKRDKRPIAVLYDAAHAFGSAVHGQRVGCFGDAEVFSLSVTKTLVSVEGGMVASRNAEFIRRMRKMRNYGIEENYNAWWPGLNSKMSEFHAIIGLHNVRRLDQLLAARQRKARYYQDQIRRRTHFAAPIWPEHVVHTFKDYTIMTPASLTDRRHLVVAALNERGIETRSYFDPPAHQQHFFARFADRPLPKTEYFARRVISIPFYATITETEMDYVVTTLAEVEEQLQ